LPWDELEVDAGRVPGRFMLGKAFFRLLARGVPAVSGAPPIAPDFGDMRFIR
jgi:hypothetical protein